MVPGQAHDIDSSSAICEVPLIESFIEQASPAHLDTTCLSKLALPSFILDLPELQNG